MSDTEIERRRQIRALFSERELRVLGILTQSHLDDLRDDVHMEATGNPMRFIPALYEGDVSFVNDTEQLRDLFND